MLENGTRCNCALSDISHIGARISIPDSDVIPDNFILFLAENGAARRRCRVIWRKSRELGVKFETRLDDRVRASGTPKSADHAAPKQVEPIETSA